VAVVATTNRLEAIDPALCRPGRFDYHIPVSLPDKTGRLAILKVYLAAMRTRGRLDMGFSILRIGLENVVTRFDCGIPLAIFERLSCQIQGLFSTKAWQKSQEEIPKNQNGLKGRRRRHGDYSFLEIGSGGKQTL
jgi:SpoVK/Ycf46/Vps4 family AAA+-type ATPase